MSPRLALASAISVFVMSAYVLFGAEAAQHPFGHGALENPISAAAPVLPDATRLLPSVN